MSISSFDTVFFTLAFLVPGFVCHTVLSSLVPRQQSDSNLSFLRFLTLSSINYALWAWLIYLVFSGGWNESHPEWTAAMWAWVILVSPALLGLLWGKLSERGWARGILLRLGFNPLHAAPTAWDYKFHSQSEPVWIVVTLTDGSTVRGRFGNRSFASSDSADRDIYIEEVYRFEKGSPWIPALRSDGILVRGSFIRNIEFLEWNEETSK